MKHLVIGKHISEHTPQSYMEHVKGLYRNPETNPMSKSVPDIKIIFGSKIIVKFEREPKVLKLEEVELLAAEYAQTVEDLTALLKKRKIGVLNAAGENINAGKPRVAGKKRAPRRKKDADGVADAGRSGPGGDKLQQPGPSLDVPQEGVLHVSAQADDAGRGSSTDVRVLDSQGT